jgi:hypothetical protein
LFGGGCAFEQGRDRIKRIEAVEPPPIMLEDFPGEAAVGVSSVVVAEVVA